MTENMEDKNSEVRFELLQSLCKQQIMINEALKSELTRLETMYQKNHSPLSLLLNELLDNHSSCSNAVIKEDTGDAAVPTIPKKSSNPGLTFHPVPAKKPRTCSNVDVKPTIPLHNPSATGSLVTVQKSADDKQAAPHENQVDTTMRHARSDRTCLLSSPPSSTSAAVRGPTSRLQNLATQLNSTPAAIPYSDSLASPVSNWQHLCSPGSPPAVVVSTSAVSTAGSTQPQRPSKVTSLVTTSAISSSSNIPFVPFSDQKVSSAGVHTLKNLSITNRNIGGISLQNPSMTRPSAPVSVMLTSSYPGTGAQSAIRSAKLPPTLPNASALRFSCTTPGQRILIQQSGVNARSILVQPAENTMSGLSDEPQ
ncbi:hypothetical protein P879_09542 [Paragonimus westermani]|uniref:Uncharacterized protein n=1 Tax=Paragonimus westermani TaxID=34504 RepID=A0A8T0D888_9TREM|nr:hypothetical protein P879_09542 [Paragonimus westermani]